MHNLKLPWHFGHYVFPFPSPQGLSRKITWCWWLQLLIFQTAVLDLTFPGPATLFSRRNWMSAIWGRIKYVWGVDPQAALSFYVSRAWCFLGSLADENWGSVNPSCWWGVELLAEKEQSFDGRFLSDREVGEVKRLSTWFCRVKQSCMENTVDACLTRLPQSWGFFFLLLLRFLTMPAGNNI